MAASYESPTEYIQHHLSFLAQPVRDGDFWTIHIDTIATTLVLGVLAFGFLWLVTRKATTGVPSRTQAFVELLLGFVNEQVKGIYNGSSKMVAPIALTTGLLVLMMNAMDFLPVDIMAWIYEHVFRVDHFRGVPTTDVNTTFALALSVFGLMIFYSIKIKGLGGWVQGFLRAVRGKSAALAVQPVVQHRRVHFQAVVAACGCS
jgi:F-type H+-transporting ATPase subunit a